MRKTKSERAAEQRAARDELGADLVKGQTIYVKRSDGNVRVIRLFRVQRVKPERIAPRLVHYPEGARLVEITADVRRLLMLRETRNGLSIPGGGSDPCWDTVMGLAEEIFNSSSALRCEEL